MNKNLKIVENAIKDADESVIPIANLYKILNQIKKNELMLILKKLEDNNKILIGSKGVCWIYVPKSKLKRLLKSSLEI